MPRRARVLISLALTLLLLYLFLRGVDLRAAWQEARSARPTWLFVCAIGSFLHYLLRAARWRLQLASSGKTVPYGLCLSCTAFGYFVSAFLPGRVGDIVRPVLLGSRAGISRSFALATVLVERVVLDTLTLLTLLAIVLVTGSAGPAAGEGQDSFMESLRTGSVLLGGAILAAVAVAACILARRGRLLAWFRRPGGRAARWSKALDALERFGDGLASLGRPQIWPPVLLVSVLTWAAVGLGMWGGLRAFGEEVGYGGAMAITALAAVGVALPTPGGFGGFHLAVQFGLQVLYGVPAERSVPAALVTHLLLLLPAFTIGGWTAWREGLGLLDSLGRTGREEE